MSNISLYLNATNSRQIEPCRFSVYVTWMMRKLDGIKVHECVYVDTRAIKAHIHSNVATTQCIDHNKRNNHCNKSPNPGQQSKKVPQCSILHQNMDNWHRHNYGFVMVWPPITHTSMTININLLMALTPLCLKNERRIQHNQRLLDDVEKQVPSTK